MKQLRKQVAVLAATCVTTCAFSVGQLAYAEESLIEEVVVTGSRIRRDEFSSPTPIQVINVEDAIQIGVSSISELLRRTTMASGQQIDRTFNSNAGASNASEGPPTGGVGSANISLRGLGPERTLVLVNSRRLGSSGVRGAPAQPDLNLLPLNLVSSIEVITEGASSIYGADAVAGVVNVILRDNFEGFEFSINAEEPADDGGETRQFSFITGVTSGDTRFVFSAEYFDQERIKAGERVKCPKEIHRIEGGGKVSHCENGFFDNVALDSSFGGLAADVGGDIFSYYTPGSSDFGVPDFSSALVLPDPSAPSGSERPDERDRFTFIPFYSDWDERLDADLVQPIKRYSLVSLGGWSPNWYGGNEEIYYEAYYLKKELTNRASSEQIFPTMPGLILQEGATNPDGSPVFVDNPLNPFPVNSSLIVTLDDLPQEREVELEHVRFVAGFRGDITADFLADKNWAFDIFASYDRGTGFQSQTVLNETNLALSLETVRLDADGNLICGLETPNNDIGFLTVQPCVPFDMFNPSMFTGGPNGEGVFSTQEQRDYLLARRINRTVTEQTMFSAVITGDLFDISGGGTVKFALGGEYRKDEIDSAADFLGVSGVVAAENPLTEGETRGSRDITDYYVEFSVPLVEGRRGIEYLELEAAFRSTDESNFGSETIYRGRVTYRPIDWITASASWGTSFRAPNLREQFLADQFQSVSGDSDPCAVPDAAASGSIYNPALDTRSQVVLDNCIQHGADPFVLGLQASTSIPITVGGNASDLDAETSDSFTATLQFRPPISENWSFDIAISYFDIEIEDTVRSLSGTVIMNRCFNDAPGLSSPFCSRVTRNAGKIDSLNFADFVDASFVNIGKETSVGYDINTRLSTTFDSVFGAPLDVTWVQAYTKMDEREEQIFAGDTVDDKVGDFGTPEVRYNTSVSLRRNKWELLIAARFIDETEASRDAATQADCGVFGPNTGLAGRPSTTPFCEADSAWYEDLSLTYRWDESLRITGGIKNVSDEEPPLIDMSAGSNRLNRVTSSGYDQVGRSYFLNLTKQF